MMSNEHKEACAQAAVALCNDTIQGWIKATLTEEGGPLTCVLAALLMPNGLELILRKHLPEREVVALMTTAARMRKHCAISVREEDAVGPS